MAATVEPYLSIVARALDGRIKLPAFQRDWKWKKSQVVLLFDSLRQGFPIGGFLFIKQNITIDLCPRDFRGAKPSATDVTAEHLVLDGQQRITAGLELFYGNGGTHYFLDLNKIYELATERGVDTDDTKSIRAFLADLEAEDNYCIAHKAGKDPIKNLIEKHQLWTALLTDEIELDRALKRYKTAYPDKEDFIDYVIGKNFRPSQNTSIPITSIDDDVTVEGISRIFSTLNSTGKMLTPFELVVSILFPHNVKLSEDVEAAKEEFPYYGRLDATGDILLQTIALFSGRDTKKASLPKTIDASTYRMHRDDAVKYLNEAGQILTDKIGLGLDQSDDLLVYPVIFSPMAYVLKVISNKKLSTEQQATCQRKLARWFIASVLSSRYQQSTHDKQARDKVEILKWLEGGDDETPQWLRDTPIPDLKKRAPDSAIGKLLRALSNAHGVKDPLTDKIVGVGSGKQTTAKHHVFPTRFVKNLSGWDEKEDTANVALNIMMIEQSTNASWLNIDPLLQIQNAKKINGDNKVKSIYESHGIKDKCFNILEKERKTKQDFIDFISEREAYFINQLNSWGFIHIRQINGENDEIMDD